MKMVTLVMLLHFYSVFASLNVVKARRYSISIGIAHCFKYRFLWAVSLAKEGNPGVAQWDVILFIVGDVHRVMQLANLKHYQKPPR